MIKAVIFDLDDTLYQEIDYIKSGFLCVSKVLADKFKLKEDEIYNLILHLFKENPINVFNRLLDDLNIKYNNDYISQLVLTYRRHIPKIAFCDDVLPVLEWLVEKHIILAVVSDGYLITQEKKLLHLN